MDPASSLWLSHHRPWRTWLLLILVFCTGHTSSVLASDYPVAQGNLILTSNTDGYYNGGEWPELVRTALSVLYLALIANDEDDEAYYNNNRHGHRGHYHHRDDYYCPEELGLSFPKAQLGVGLSYFVSPDLAVGGRYIYRHDFKDNALESLGAAGPDKAVTRTTSCRLDVAIRASAGPSASVSGLPLR